jgi:hypothetical protein
MGKPKNRAASRRVLPSSTEIGRPFILRVIILFSWFLPECVNQQFEKGLQKSLPPSLFQREETRFPPLKKGE